MQIKLHCGLILDQENLDQLLASKRTDVVWHEVALPPASGMDNLVEIVFWPKSISNIAMPQERLVFIRMVRDKQDDYVGYSVESLSDAVMPGRAQFSQSDFRVLLTTTSRLEAEEAVMAEFHRFIMANI